jgi:hypothetical protein
VDSLTYGMAVLAEQHHWPHLVDVPNADVVLIPWPDGSITRCYGSEQLRELLTGAGLEVDWIRPRTVLAEQTVVHALQVDLGRMSSLVSTELALSRGRQGESLGARLVVSATRGVAG